MNETRIQDSLNWIAAVPIKTEIQPSFNWFLGRDFSVTNWKSFPMYEADFGWGRPEKCRVKTGGFDGLAIVLPSGPKGSVEGESIDVLLGALTTSMEKIMADPEFTEFANN